MFAPSKLAERFPLLALRLCGDVALQPPDGSTIEPAPGAKSLGLLAFLALEPGTHRREEVTALLWGEFPEERARASLRQALTHLRDAMGETLRVDRATVELVGPISCDVTEFLRLAPADPAAALAIDIPRFLESLAIRGSQAFEEWADAKRAELLGRYVTLLRGAARDAMARRAWQEAVHLSERWRRLQPLEDDAVAVEMEPGDGVFFNALIVHGSAPNTSTDQRRMNTFAYNVIGNNIHQCREVLRGELAG
jgi:DNA-binding SARP family transcriptional activator